MSNISRAMEYMRDKQPLHVRIFHLLILFLVLSQIIVSNFMDFTDKGEISSKTIEFVGTWIHIGTGLVLLPIALIFIFIELKRHGFRYFFPYLYGNLSQIKKDIQQITQFKLPEAEPHGIATVVQGLGLGALILVILSGASWYISWVSGSALAKDLKEVHELLTGLIEAYVIGHGGMGVLHLFFQMKANPVENQ